MKITKIVLVSAAAITLGCSAALAQRALSGTITKVDEANGKIAVQQTESGTVGARSDGGAVEFKVQDGLLFNALRPGDKVVFTATDTLAAQGLSPKLRSGDSASAVDR